MENGHGDKSGKKMKNYRLHPTYPYVFASRELVFNFCRATSSIHLVKNGQYVKFAHFVIVRGRGRSVSSVND